MHSTAPLPAPEASAPLPRYGHSREESAEILRLVIARMAEHQAPFDPTTFTVWYEHLAGINPGLSEAMARRLAAVERLAQGDIERLHREHVAAVQPADAERFAVDFERVTRSIAASAQSAGDTAGEYCEQLVEFEQVLLSKDPNLLAPRLDAALASTQAVSRQVQALRETALASQAQVEQLRKDLLRSRIEAMTDPLTRLLNRKGLEQRLGTVLASRPAPGTAHCLMMVDVDCFKRINDSHGHLVGDSVLEGLGNVLQRVTANENAACARYGGDEFIVLLEATTLARTAALGDKICSLVRGLKLRHRATREAIASVTVSVGIAACKPGDDAMALIESADKALYRSKTMGRDRVTVA